MCDQSFASEGCPVGEPMRLCQQQSAHWCNLCMAMEAYLERWAHSLQRSGSKRILAMLHTCSYKSDAHVNYASSNFQGDYGTSRLFSAAADCTGTIARQLVHRPYVFPALLLPKRPTTRRLGTRGPREVVCSSTRLSVDSVTFAQHSHRQCEDSGTRIGLLKFAA